MKRKIIVRGPVLSQTGYGEQARFALRALRQKEHIFDIYVVNTDWGRSNWIWDDNEERQWFDELIRKTTLLPKEQRKFDMSLQVTIPNEWEKMAHYNIGYTAGVETTKISKEWIKKANEMQKLIFVSNFSKEVFDNTNYTENNQVVKCSTPSAAVNYAVRDIPVKELNLDLTCDFNFLAVCQWGPRKNLDNLIKWFVNEFKDEEVGLVLKTNIIKNCVYDRQTTLNKLNALVESQNIKDRKCKIHLVHGYLDDGELASLYTNPKIKALVTTSHGEGFGLPIFEAANHALPIVAPDWSGYIDFLYMPTKNNKGKIKNKAMFAKVNFDLKPVQKEYLWKDIIIEDSMWAYADESSFKHALRDVYKDYGRFKSQAKKLQSYLKKEFKEDKKLHEFAIECLPIDWVEPEDFNSVSFCIATNAAKVEKTKKVIKALQAQITTKEIEIIVSGVTAPFEKDEELKNIKFVSAPDVANDGYLAELRNLSGKEASGDVICWLDDDMLFPPGWLWQLESYSADEGWDIVGNRIFNPDGSRFWDRSFIEPHVLVDYDHPSIDDRFYQTGGFWVVRKEVFEEHKWDGSLLIYADKNQGRPNEDVEYTKRLKKDGYLIKFDKQNIIWHWDNAYTQVQVQNGMFQTLRKADIEKALGPQNFPPHSEQFVNLLQMMGLDQDA